MCHSGLQNTASGGRSARSATLLRTLPPPSTDSSSEAALAKLTNAAAPWRLSWSAAECRARPSATASLQQLPPAVWRPRSFGGGDWRVSAHSAESLPSNGLLTRSIAAATRRRRAASSGLRHGHQRHGQLAVWDLLGIWEQVASAQTDIRSCVHQTFEHSPTAGRRIASARVMSEQHMPHLSA